MFISFHVSSISLWISTFMYFNALLIRHIKEIIKFIKILYDGISFNLLRIRYVSRDSSGKASSDELVMQNTLRMRKYDPACAMQSCSRSMSNQPIFLGYINASISDHYLLFRCSMQLKLPLPRQISSQCRILS